MIFYSLIIFIVSMFVLVKSADLVVTGASSLAKFFNVSDWVIGILIVGIGTSIPEMSITISSVLKNGDVGIGVILGSNIFNLLFILGLSAIVSPIVLKRHWAIKDLIINAGVVLTTGFFAFTSFFGDNFQGISRLEGIIIFFLFVVWIRHVLTNRDDINPRKEDHDSIILITDLFIVIIGLLGVLFGGHWVVSSIQRISEFFGMNEVLISILVLGIGTSLPELTISIKAIKKRARGIAVGNIIGSNIFDFLGIIGISALFGKISVPNSTFFDFGFLLFSSLVLLGTMFFGKKFVIEKHEGFIMISLYIIYVIYLVNRAIM